MLIYDINLYYMIHRNKTYFRILIKIQFQVTTFSNQNLSPFDNSTLVIRMPREFFQQNLLVNT